MEPEMSNEENRQARPYSIRVATRADIPALESLVEASVRGLGPSEYSERQIELSLQHVFGVDTLLIDDGTYYVVEAKERDPQIIGCGGWSFRKTPFGGDQAEAQDSERRDSDTEPAVIRAFFVHPDVTRQGIGRQLLDVCESAAREAGFTDFELTATLTGYPLYAACGYEDIDAIEIPLADGVTLSAIRMENRS
jgi:N-acetylglutamate synthase-like GNAT family acetyltransferase